MPIIALLVILLAVLFSKVTFIVLPIGVLFGGAMLVGMSKRRLA